MQIIHVIWANIQIYKDLNSKKNIKNGQSTWNKHFLKNVYKCPKYS